MRVSVRYDDQPTPSRPQELCNVDLYVNTRDDLVQAQHLINALLQVLPQRKKEEV